MKRPKACRQRGASLFQGSTLCGVPRHRVTVGSVRVREPSHVLGCELLRGVGFSWRCNCGERGKVHTTWRQARDEAESHRSSCLKA